MRLYGQINGWEKESRKVEKTWEEQISLSPGSDLIHDGICPPGSYVGPTVNSWCRELEDTKFLSPGGYEFSLAADRDGF
jgi:hypothetical protein